MPISWPFQGRRLPMRMISQNDTAGTTNTGHTLVRKNMCVPSALQQIGFGDVDRAPVAVDEQHDCQADTDLGGGDGDDEQGEDLPGGGAFEGSEGDQVDVDGVEDELDRHQDEHTVLAGQHAVDARAEEEGRQQEILEQIHQSRLAMTTAPTRAASRTTDTTSKGMTNLAKMSSPTAAVRWVSVGSSLTPWKASYSTVPSAPARNRATTAAIAFWSLSRSVVRPMGARVSMMPNR